MNIYNDLVNHKEKLALVGLGYVGMPIAVAFSRVIDVIGFDLNVEKIELYKSGIDPTHEVVNQVISECSIDFTADENRIRDAKFIIIAVPTPVKDDKTPDLSLVENASRIVGRNLTQDAIVVFESTVYPGVTEELCIPILEEESGMKCGEGFKVGYSPERINPGDTKHRLETIVKVVSGIDEESLDQIAKVYELVVKAGVYRAESIKVAEAAKVIENSQRDINIAFMNELSIIFNKMGIDTQAVLRAAKTKWNFLNFTPGLVGGHCIGVDPYYLTYRAEQFGYISQVILVGRRINDSMGKYVSETVIKKLISEEISIKDAKITILGFTFKENCPDTRNTRVIDIYRELKEYGINPTVVDPIADPLEVKHEYDLVLGKIEDVHDLDALIIAVSHDEFKTIGMSQIEGFFKPTYAENKMIFDIKGILDKSQFENNGFKIWRL